MTEELDITKAPKLVRDELASLDIALDKAIPPKQVDRNLLIATWNLRAFGSMQKKWESAPADRPRRNFRDVRCIASILSRFDVVALQEVHGDLRALRHTLRALGPDWGFTLTDVARGKGGNDERLAFLFDTRRVKPSGLACELVIPDDRPIAKDALTRQFARTPYAVSFVSSNNTFILVTLHILYGEKPADRAPELAEIANWLSEWAEQEEDWKHNLIALGDFNITTGKEDDPLLQAFVSTGLTPAPKLNDQARSIFDRAEDKHFYDQIAWFEKEGKPTLTLGCLTAGGFDFVKEIAAGLELEELSWHISDHYPLWVEFALQRTQP